MLRSIVIDSNKTTYRLVECPGFTAIEDTETGEYLVSIYTKYRSRLTGEWKFLPTEKIEDRKKRVLDIFNKN